MRVPLRPGAVRLCALAAALAAVVPTSIDAWASTETLPMQAEATRIRLRDDTTRRIFRDFTEPAARMPRPNSPRADRVVTSCADDGPGSLRDTILHAADGDRIDLTQLRCARITLTTGAIGILDPQNRAIEHLEIVGPGQDRLTLDAEGKSRVFVHPRSRPVRPQLTLRGLSLENGFVRATGFNVTGGGCVASAGYVTLIDTALRNCYAAGEGAYGGALYAYGLEMQRSILSGNHALGVHEAAGTAACGGGAFIYNVQMFDSTIADNLADHVPNPPFDSFDNGGALVTVRGGSMSGSTISGNISQGRGGGFSSYSPVQIINSTISGNVARTREGGGLWVRRPATMQVDNVTITQNSAGTVGGGIFHGGSPDPVDLRSSIVFGNFVAGRPGDIHSQYGSMIAGSANIIGTSSPLAPLPADTRAVDPRLGPLATNGGPTRTHELYADSPALDTGINAVGLATDQRGPGFVRVYGPAADVGAFEVNGVPREPVRGEQHPVPGLSGTTTALMAVLMAAVGVFSRRLRRRE